MSCNSETCQCFLFTGEIYQDQFYIQDAIDQDDFATRDVFQDDSDEVQIFEEKLLEDENSAKSKRKRGVWISEDKVLLGNRLLVRFLSDKPACLIIRLLFGFVSD